jgi:hypothetical protein
LLITIAVALLWQRPVKAKQFGRLKPPFAVLVVL